MIDINYIKENKHRAAWGIYITAALTVFILLSDTHASSASVYRSLVFCGKTLIPSLFPMLMVNTVMIGSGLADAVGRAAGRLYERVFGISNATVAAFIIGILSGYPAGAICVVDLYEKGRISKDDAEIALCFCSNTGMPFLIISAGNMLGGSGYGIILFTAQTAAAVTVGIAASKLSAPCERSISRSMPESRTDISLFADAVRRAVPTMLTVCGFVVFFSAVLETALLRWEGVLPDEVIAAVYGFFEISHGVGFAASHFGAPISILFVSAICGWSGISVYMQISAFSLKSGLSLKKYMLAKTAMTLLCPAYAYIILRLIKIFFSK